MHVIYRGIMMLIIAGALGGASEVMAGAYDTGEGHGFDSCASTEIVYAGTIIRFTRIPPNIRLMLYDEIDHLRCAALFQCGPCLPAKPSPPDLAEAFFTTSSLNLESLALSLPK